MIKAQDLESSRRFDDPNDRLNLDKYLQILRTKPGLLKTTIQSNDPELVALYNDATADVHKTVISINARIKNLISLVLDQCGSTKCNPNSKSKCDQLICQVQDWLY